ncbi:uncharacterized protein BT62DRAFT_1006442 [Guyanagaster necrorhizus]|uniref:Uncharacterized protein n=1 Tax=Guyanagaster necrorhizus TaxID=856835 RepID=A0A9P8ARR9_9AGAR|nr:uncharacterized protein BT62DRAFT_1006442 [Guyanagaster necrorhizus MCA 3950]KAG7445489.1 hypothetical protein BT62DRAFT_1006442 [Guyanagaster necrorhizus MCA 3950]
MPWACPEKGIPPAYLRVTADLPVSTIHTILGPLECASQFCNKPALSDSLPFGVSGCGCARAGWSVYPAVSTKRPQGAPTTNRNLSADVNISPGLLRVLTGSVSVLSLQYDMVSVRHVELIFVYHTLMALQLRCPIRTSSAAIAPRIAAYPGRLESDFPSLSVVVATRQPYLRTSRSSESPILDTHVTIASARCQDFDYHRETDSRMQKRVLCMIDSNAARPRGACRPFESFSAGSRSSVCSVPQHLPMLALLFALAFRKNLSDPTVSGDARLSRLWDGAATEARDPTIGTGRGLNVAPEDEISNPVVRNVGPRCALRNTRTLLSSDTGYNAQYIASQARNAFSASAFL